MKKHIRLYPIFLLVSFIFFSGAVGMCQKVSYEPCTITFTSPANGKVFLKDVASKPIKVIGFIKPATDEKKKKILPLSLKANKDNVAIDSSTGRFEYLWKVDSEYPMHTCTFTVTDKNLITNKERLTILVGNSLKPGDTGVTDNAARLYLTQNVLNDIVAAATKVINKYKNDYIYGSDSEFGTKDPKSPFAGATPFLPFTIAYPVKDIPFMFNMNPNWDPTNAILHGTEEVSEKPAGCKHGFLNIGDVQLSVKSMSGNWIECSMKISPNDKVVPNWYLKDQNKAEIRKALWLQGWLFNINNNRIPPNYELDKNLWVSAGSLEVRGVRIYLKKIPAGKGEKIMAVIDMSRVDFDIIEVESKLGWVKVPLQFILDIVKDSLKQTINGMKFEVAVSDTAKFGFQLSKFDLSAWIMRPSVFQSDEKGISVDLGLGMKLMKGIKPILPEATTFYSTRIDEEIPNIPPDISNTGNGNMAIAISDDLMNNAVFTAIQSGLVYEDGGIDATESWKGKLKAYGVPLSPKFKASCKIAIPPVFDFSVPDEGEENVKKLGRLYAHNIVFEFTDILPSPSPPTRLKMSIDGDIIVNVTLSEDGKRILGSVDPKSESSLIINYTNLTNVSFFPTIGKSIANEIFGALVSYIDFEIPVIGPENAIYGLTGGVSIQDIYCKNHYLVVKLKADIK